MPNEARYTPGDHNPCAHSAAAARLFTARARFGVDKYGTTLEKAGLEPLALLDHLAEELADAGVYVQALRARIMAIQAAAAPVPPATT